MKRICIMLLAGIFCFIVALAPPARGGDPAKKGAASGTLDKTLGTPVYTWVNANRISTILRNNGTADIDVAQANSGLQYPKGSNKTAIYLSGPIWGARVAGDPQVRVGGSAFTSGLQPGKLLSPGVAEDPDLPKNRIYRVRRDYRAGDLSSEVHDEGKSAEEIRAQYDLDWKEWPVGDGAPYEDVDKNGSYDPNVDIPGVAGADQTVWFVTNDNNPTNTLNLYGTQPLGVECQFTTWAYAQEGQLGNMIFKSYLLINKSTVTFDSMYICQWVDPDLGFSDDDVVGCDTSLSLGFVYNGTNVDQTYGDLPPPAAGFDFFQGPRVPSPGSSAIFRGQRVEGFRNLPMTAFFYFIKGDPTLIDPTRGDPAGASQFYNYMRGRVGLTGQPFLTPDGQPTAFVVPGDPLTGAGWVDGVQYSPDDRRMGLSSGPFTMAPGDTQEVVVAEICAGAIPGVDRLTAVGLLKFFDKAAQLAYENGFRLPSPPPAPKVTAAELDGEILLNWGSNPEAIEATETSDNNGFRFQGYNVYQLPSPSAAISEASKIAVFDLAGDGITRITDYVFDPQIGVVTPKVVQLGTDSGIKRYLSVSADATRGGAKLSNGTRYYFAVTAYSYSSDPNAVPNNLETPLQVLTLVPHSANPGYRATSAAGDTVAGVRHTGSSDGSIVPLVIDPSRGTGHTYEVRFADQGGETVWNLIDYTSRDTLARNQTNQSGDDNYPIIDGIMVKVLGPPPGMKEWSIGSNGLRHITWANADPDGVWHDLEGYEHTIGNGYEWWFSGSTVTVDRLKNVQLRFAGADGTWDPTVPQPDPNFSRAYRYLRGATAAPAKPEFAPWIKNPSAGYPYQDYNYSVPFAAYDMSVNPPRRLAVGHVENNRANGLVDGRYWPLRHDATNANNVADNSPREWFFIFDVDYSETPLAELQVDLLNETVPLLWWGIVNRRATAPDFVSGSEFTIVANQINTPSDIFAFDAPSVTYSGETAVNDVQRINVVPNPYYGVNSEEINKYNRFVTFTHLPRVATIRIFNLGGILVREIRKSSDSQFERWDLANESGLPVGSGLYIAHIEMPELNGEVKILKLAIVQEQQILDRF